MKARRDVVRFAKDEDRDGSTNQLDLSFSLSSPLHLLPPPHPYRIAVSLPVPTLLI